MGLNFQSINCERDLYTRYQSNLKSDHTFLAFLVDFLATFFGAAFLTTFFGAAFFGADFLAIFFGAFLTGAVIMKEYELVYQRLIFFKCALSEEVKICGPDFFLWWHFKKCQKAALSSASCPSKLSCQPSMPKPWGCRQESSLSGPTSFVFRWWVAGEKSSKYLPFLATAFFVLAGIWFLLFKILIIKF